MSTLDAGLYGNLADIANREDPDGKIAMIIEQLSQTNHILQDAPFRPTNDKDIHKTTRRTSLTTPTRRLLNRGIAPSKTSTGQVEDRCTSVESLSQIDEKLERREGENFNAYRWSEDKGHMEGMNQKIAYDMIYASQVADPENMSGLASRYSTPGAGPYGANVIDAGGSTSTCSSIWLVLWGEQTVHGLYPKNSKAGLQMDDLGKINVPDPETQGYFYQAYCTKFVWDYGLSVRDPRAVVRIGSIDIPTLGADLTPTEGSTIYDYMLTAHTRATQGGMGSYKAVFYMNETLFLRFRQQAFHRSNSYLTLDQSEGGGTKKLVPHFDNVPIHRLDQISNTEAAI